MIEDLALSMERGQKVEQSLEKSERLVTTSSGYKSTANKVERTMWARKWKLIALAILVTIAIIGFIWLLIKL